MEPFETGRSDYSPFEILTTAGAVLLTLFLACVFLELDPLEADLRARATNEIVPEAFYWSAVEVNGQDVTLYGATRSSELRDQALAVLGGLEGVAEFHAQVDVIPGVGVCQKRLDLLNTPGAIRFKRGQDELEDVSYAVLEKVAEVAADCGIDLEVGAHTHSRGDADLNRKLTERRAAAIARYLVRSDLPAARISSRGYGETQPVADNRTEEGRESNDRVTLRVRSRAA
ncbi:MAG: OmpA family protein [Pseudomonadales bacterium]